jgi:hypothetical protein
VRYEATWESGGDAVQKTAFSRPVEGVNNIGTQGQLVTDPGFWGEGGPLSRFANRMPGINAIAGMHDEFIRQYSDSLLRTIVNVPLMLPAVVMTVPALVGETPGVTVGYLTVRNSD